MSQILTLQYRPKTFAELIGQQSLTQAIQRQYESKREPLAWLFHGQTGGGKTTVARIMALSLQCTHQKEFGNPCDDCYKNRSDYSIHEINASEVSGVEQISQIVEGSEYRPHPPSRRKVYILDEAQRLSSAAQNLLLKYFEDTPKTTVWIVCTTEPEKILHTLRRRCMQFSLQPLKRKDVRELLINIASKEKCNKDLESLTDIIYQARIQSPALILMALEKFLAGIPAEKAVLAGDTTVDIKNLASRLYKGDLEEVHNIMKDATLEDAKLIRVAVSKYLNAILLKSLKPSNNLTWGILKLAEADRVSESMQVQYTSAILHMLCRKFGGGSPE